MYLVPMEIPNHCNKCPFGMCNYNRPQWSRKYDKVVSSVDGEENKVGTYGYVCNVEFQKDKRYKKVLRANIGEDIEKTDWCELREVD